jgi:hypothetical protein
MRGKTALHVSRPDDGRSIGIEGGKRDTHFVVMAVGTNDRVKTEAFVKTPLEADKPVGRVRQFLYAGAFQLESL